MSNKLAGLQEYAPIILTRLSLGFGLRLVNIIDTEPERGRAGMGQEDFIGEIDWDRHDTFEN